jgi:lysophospholipase L1-like esterase
MTDPRGSPALTFGALLLVLVVTIGVAEAWARARWSEEDLRPVPDMPFLMDDPLLLWRVRPHLDLDSPGMRLTTNASGLRAPERAPKSGLRVLSLGESSTWGYMVQAADTYSAQLEALLGARGLPTEVVNAGQPAWSSWQSAAFLETEGAAWEPDAVLVYHSQNDIQTRGAGNPRDPFRVALSDRQLTEARAPFAPLSRVLARSRLQAVIWREFLGPRLLASATRTAGPADAVRVPEPDRVAALGRIAAWCEDHGAALLLVQPVYAHQQDDFVPRFAHDRGLPLVDLPAEKARAGVPPFFMPDDTHPTVAGHRWIAETVAPQLAALLRARAGANRPAIDAPSAAP